MQPLQRLISAPIRGTSPIGSWRSLSLIGFRESVLVCLNPLHAVRSNRSAKLFWIAPELQLLQLDTCFQSGGRQHGRLTLSLRGDFAYGRALTLDRSITAFAIRTA